MLKKILFSVIFIFFCNTSYAIDFSAISSIETSCIWANVNATIYIPNWQNSLTETVWDSFWHPNDRFIANNWTLVKLWQSENNLVTWCNSSTNWSKASDIAPWNNEQIIALYSRCTFNKPTNINNRTLQFVFNIRHWAIWGWNTTQTRYYYPRSWWNNNPATRESKTINNYFVSNYQVHENECLNVTLAWCWDWQVTNWEVCDPSDTNRTWWWVWGCNNSCQPITTNTPTCTSLTATPITWVNSLTSTLTCTWTNASTYTINCWNGQTINASTWTCNYSAVWTYTPTCFVNGTITSPTCQRTVSVTNNSSSSSSSGWGTYQCRDISKTWNQVTCVWNHLVQTFRLNCSWTYLFSWATVWSWNTTSATFTCSDNSATCSVYNQIVTESSFYTWATNPACNLTPSSSSSSWGSTSSSSSSSWWSSPDYCWDWIVQRPNENYQLEECDFWTWTWPSWCTSTCKIDWISSIPNDWEIVFWPSDNVIIGDWMNPYLSYSLNKPSILNKSPYDLYFDSLCVVKKSGSNTLNWWTRCEPIWKTLFPWSNYTFTTYPNFTWNTSAITSWTFWDNTIVTTIEHEWVLYTNAYFASELKVRVSKPSIATTWWGTSFIRTSSNISNVSKVTEVTNNSEKNKNFIWAWVSSWDLSSYSTNTKNVDSVNTVSEEWNKYNKAVNDSSTITWLSIGTTSNIGDFNSYNWISNAYILKNTSFVIWLNTFSWLSWPRTYIIENWDLLINSNINYSGNIAIVVKWWNIIIDKSVTSITWTYISIPNWSSGWDIKWTWWSTNNILTVKWSFYWNSQNLISQRTYIKENSWLLSVWTIVSFWSSVFRDPAPLTSTFINEYLDATKVAK